jgi:hypothetical protein
MDPYMDYLYEIISVAPVAGMGYKLWLVFEGELLDHPSPVIAFAVYRMRSAAYSKPNEWSHGVAPVTHAGVHGIEEHQQAFVIQLPDGSCDDIFTQTWETLEQCRVTHREWYKRDVERARARKVSGGQSLTLSKK